MSEYLLLDIARLAGAAVITLYALILLSEVRTTLLARRQDRRARRRAR